MSLQVWLPLNGDLHNQGLYDVNIVNNGATINDNGKIGKCYSFNGTSNYFKINNPINNINIGFSICCWVKLNSVGITHHTLYTARTSIGTGIALFILAANTIRLDDGDVQTTFSNSSVKANEWIHICVTRNSTTKKLYINGEFVSSFNNVGDLSNIGQYGVIGASEAGDNGIGTANFINGYLNDFRIYDHCLSPKEVKEISKGLVLHYPLNQPERSRNLLIGSSKYMKNSPISSTPNRDDAYTYYSDIYTSSLINGETYTIQCNTDGLWGNHGTVGDRYCTLWLNDTVTNYHARFSGNKVETGHKSWTFVWSQPSNERTQVRVNTYGAGNSTVHFWDLKIEKGNNSTIWTPAPEDTDNWGLTEWDTSGYGNNGIVTTATAPGWSSDSPRYNGCYNFTTSNNIYSDFNPSFITSGSLSFWRKCDSTGKAWLPLNGSSDNCAYIMATSSSNAFWHGRVTGTKTIYVDGKISTTPINDGQWHHYVITDINLSQWAMLKINTHVGYNNPGNYSDIRIYTTILDTNDVLEIYQTSASIIKET